MSTNFFLSALAQLSRKMQFEVIAGERIISKPQLCVDSVATDFNFCYTLVDVKISKYEHLQ